MFTFQSVARARRRERTRLLLRSLVLAASTLGAAAAQCQVASAAASAQLAPVIVTATRFATSMDDLPFGVSVLTAELIKSSGVTTVNEAIMKLLGVPGRLDLNGGADYALDLRGFGSTADSNQVVVVDGLRINEADLGGTRLAGIAIDSVERIEVIRGSGAVLYGEGATGGVIVITTRGGQGGAGPSRVELFSAAGNQGVRELRGSASVAADAVSLHVAANRRDAYNDRANFNSRSEGAAATAQWSQDGLRAGARVAEDKLDSGLPGSLTAAQYAADPHKASTPSDSGRIRNRRGSLFGDVRLAGWQLGLDAGWRGKTVSSDYVSGGYSYGYDVSASQYALRARHADDWGSASHTWIVGLDQGDWTRTVQGAGGTVSRQHTLALYLKDDVAVPTGQRLSFGWRTASIQEEVSGTDPRIDQRVNAWEFGVVQPLSPGVSVYGRVGDSFRLPNADEFGFTTPGLALKTQRARDTELGVRAAHANGRAELRVYRSALTSEIGYDPGAVGPSSLYGFDGANVNFDPTVREGVEVEVSQALAASATLRLHAAARRARFSAGPYRDRDVPLTPHQTLSLRADWSPADGHRIDGGVQWVSSQTPTLDNACRMPGYITADVRYAFQWHAAEWALRVSNLADLKYYTQAFSCAGRVVSSIYPEPGRALTASVRLKF